MHKVIEVDGAGSLSACEHGVGGTTPEGCQDHVASVDRSVSKYTRLYYTFTCLTTAIHQTSHVFVECVRPVHCPTKQYTHHQ